jgi:hypothetical protein
MRVKPDVTASLWGCPLSEQLSAGLSNKATPPETVVFSFQIVGSLFYCHLSFATRFAMYASAAFSASAEVA